ncbi:MAG: hypothetical protein ABIO82_04770 [Ginsengibacter sp.]
MLNFLFSSVIQPYAFSMFEIIPGNFLKRATISFAVFVLLWIVPQHASAQLSSANDPYFSDDYSYELGLSFAAMNCFTDLGGKKGNGHNFFSDINPGNSEFAGSIYLSASYRSFIAVRFEGTFGAVKASDNVLAKIKNESPYRYQRNLSFKSSIDEVTLLAEIHPLFFKRYHVGEKIPRISPYFVGGIGIFSFNPTAKLAGKWIDLQPLSTEGEGFPEYPDRKPYKLTQFNIPLGLGVKMNISQNFNLSIEGVSRILFTDYLDDVSTNYIDKEIFSNYFTGTTLSNALLLNNRKYEIDPTLTTSINEQRGNPSKKDSYFTINLKLGYVFQLGL